VKAVSWDLFSYKRVFRKQTASTVANAMTDVSSRSGKRAGQQQRCSKCGELGHKAHSKKCSLHVSATEVSLPVAKRIQTGSRTGLAPSLSPLPFERLEDVAADAVVSSGAPLTTSAAVSTTTATATSTTSDATTATTSDTTSTICASTSNALRFGSEPPEAISTAAATASSTTTNGGNTSAAASELTARNIQVRFQRAVNENRLQQWADLLYEATVHVLRGKYENELHAVTISAWAKVLAAKYIKGSSVSNLPSITAEAAAAFVQERADKTTELELENIPPSLAVASLMVSKKEEPVAMPSAMTMLKAAMDVVKTVGELAAEVKNLARATVAAIAVAGGRESCSPAASRVPSSLSTFTPVSAASATSAHMRRHSSAAKQLEAALANVSETSSQAQEVAQITSGIPGYFLNARSEE
jgi:hypothetical protein